MRSVQARHVDCPPFDNPVIASQDGSNGSKEDGERCHEAEQRLRA